MTIEQLFNYSETVFKHDGETYTARYNPDSGKLSIDTEITGMSLVLEKIVFDYIAEWLDKQPSPVDLERETLIEQIHSLYGRVMAGEVHPNTLGEYKGFYYCYHNLGPKAYWSIKSSCMEELARTFTIIATADWLLELTDD